MKRRTLLAGSAAAAATSTLPAFAQGRKLKVAFANFNDEASFGASVLRGMQAAARARTPSAIPGLCLRAMWLSARAASRVR